MHCGSVECVDENNPVRAGGKKTKQQNNIVKFQSKVTDQTLNTSHPYVIKSSITQPPAVNILQPQRGGGGQPCMAQNKSANCCTALLPTLCSS